MLVAEEELPEDTNRIRDLETTVRIGVAPQEFLEELQLAFGLVVADLRHALAAVGEEGLAALGAGILPTALSEARAEAAGALLLALVTAGGQRLVTFADAAAAFGESRGTSCALIFAATSLEALGPGVLLEGLATLRTGGVRFARCETALENHAGQAAALFIGESREGAADEDDVCSAATAFVALAIVRTARQAERGDAVGQLTALVLRAASLDAVSEALSSHAGAALPAGLGHRWIAFTLSLDAGDELLTTKTRALLLRAALFSTASEVLVGGVLAGVLTAGLGLLAAPLDAGGAGPLAFGLAGLRVASLLAAHRFDALGDRGAGLLAVWRIGRLALPLDAVGEDLTAATGALLRTATIALTVSRFETLALGTRGDLFASFPAGGRLGLLALLFDAARESFASPDRALVLATAVFSTSDLGPLRDGQTGLFASGWLGRVALSLDAALEGGACASRALLFADHVGVALAADACGQLFASLLASGWLGRVALPPDAALEGGACASRALLFADHVGVALAADACGQLFTSLLASGWLGRVALPLDAAFEGGACASRALLFADHVGVALAADACGQLFASLLASGWLGRVALPLDAAFESLASPDGALVLASAVFSTGDLCPLCDG